jgi:hypothetical protein
VLGIALIGESPLGLVLTLVASVLVALVAAVIVNRRA